MGSTLEAQPVAKSAAFADRDLWLLFWLGLSMVPLFRFPVFGLSVLAQVSVVSLLFGFWAFLTHGKNQITAAGIYCLSMAAFVGYAGLWWDANTSSTFSSTLVMPAILGHFSTLAPFAIFWRRSDSGFRGGKFSVQSGLARIMLFLGVGVVALSTAAKILTAAPFLDTGGFVGVTLVASALCGDSNLRSWVSRGRSLAVLGAGLGLYVLVFFEGFGRLTVVSLCIGVAVLMSGQFPRRLIKLGTVLIAPVMVLLITQLRRFLLAPQASAASIGSAPSATEVDSMVSPLGDFGRVLSTPALDGVGDGSTFFATLVSFIPRAVWPEKPIGFGAELTARLEPEMVSVGHSMAALSAGEWYFNFGMFGLLAMTGVLGFLIRTLDLRLLSALSGEAASTRRQVIQLVSLVFLIGGLADLAWVGSFTFVTRVGMRVAVAVVLILLFLTARNVRGLVVSNSPRSAADL